MAEYRYLVADTLTDEVRAEIPFADVAYGPELNGHGGAFNGVVPTQLPQVSTDTIDPGNTSLYVERDGALVWGGIVWTATPQGTTLAVGAEGFLSYAARRHVRDGFDHNGIGFRYVGIDPLWITRNAWAYMQSKPGGDIGVTIGAETSPIRVGTATEPVQWAWWEDPVISEQIEALASSDNGFDYAIDVAYNSAGQIVKTLRLGYPKLGRRHADLAFAAGVNVAEQVEVDVDATLAATVFDAFGSGEGRNKRRQSATNPDPARLRLEGSATYGLEKSDTRLAELARSGLASASKIATVPSVVLRPHPSWRLGDFAPGDEIYASLHDGYASFDGWARVMAYTVEPERGDRVTVALAAADRFVYGQGQGDDTTLGVPPGAPP